MSRNVTVAFMCDSCGTDHPVNHWFVTRLAYDCSLIYKKLEIRAFADSGAEDDWHWCSMGCLSAGIESFSRWLLKKQDDSAAEHESDEEMAARINGGAK